MAAVDPDAAALETLRAALDTLGMGDRFTVRPAQFESVTDTADVVFFEFCLHVLGTLQVREQVYRGYRSRDDLMIAEVTQGGPAGRAGLKVGDNGIMCNGS